MESVAAIAFKEGKVLLIQRRDIPVWVLPGGGVEVGESPEEACLREMEEETGYRVKILRKVAEYSPVNRLTKKTHFYEVEIVGGSAQTGDETRAVEFFTLDHLPKHLPPPYASWIADAATCHPHLLKKNVEGVTYPVLVKLLLKHPLLVGRFLLTKLGIHLN